MKVFFDICRVELVCAILRLLTFLRSGSQQSGLGLDENRICAQRNDQFEQAWKEISFTMNKMNRGRRALAAKRPKRTEGAPVTPRIHQHKLR